MEFPGGADRGEYKEHGAHGGVPDVAKLRRREVVVIGASAGGVHALRELVARLPRHLRAAILISVHTSPDNPGHLGRILARSGVLPASMARHREKIRPGTIRIAPPDHHLIVEDHRILLDRGPRVNNFRPAVDPLFVSAAEAYGPGVIGVILSGGLDDGTFGLAEIKRLGGTAVVQDPEEALTPGMPESAIGSVAVDHVLPVAGIAALIARLAGSGIERRFAGMPTQPRHRQGPRSEGRKRGMVGPGADPPSPFICPECGGALWEVDGGKFLRYECHVGHAYNGRTLLDEQGRSVEAALWGAVRVLEENAELYRRLSERYHTGGYGALAASFMKKAEDAEGRAEQIRAVAKKILESKSARQEKGTAPSGGARPPRAGSKRKD